MLINSLTEIKDNESLMDGLNLIIKKLSKTYPFVTGWGFEDDYHQFESTLFIHLIIDYDKFVEFYPDLRLGFYIKSAIRDYGQYKAYSLKGIFTSDSQNFDQEKINKSLNDSYYKLYKSDSDYVAEVVWFDNFVDKITLSVTGFVFKSDNISDEEYDLPF